METVRIDEDHADFHHLSPSLMELANETLEHETAKERVENYLGSVFTYVGYEGDQAIRTREPFLHNGITSDLLIWRSWFPEGAIGDEIWERLTTGLEAK